MELEVGHGETEVYPRVYGFLSGFITGPQYHRFSPQECSNFFRHAGYART
jgi:hypothetical protein